jgi:hypothetical protein
MSIFFNEPCMSQVPKCGVCRQSECQNRTVRALLCVNQWEEEKYFSLFRYWLKSKGTNEGKLRLRDWGLEYHNRAGELETFKENINRVQGIVSRKFAMHLLVSLAS